YVHIQDIRRHAGRTPPVPTIPIRTRGRAVGTTAWDRMGISNPLDLGCGEGAPGPGSKSLLIQQGRDLPVSLIRGEFPYPSDDRWVRPPHFVRAPGTGDLQRRAGLRLPADGHLDRFLTTAEGHVLDQVAQQLLAVSPTCRRRPPDPRQVLCQRQNPL